MVAAAIRSTVNRTTGYTSNMLMLGKEVRLPLDLMLGVERLSPTTPPEYLKGLQKAFMDSHEEARESLKNCQHRQKQDYNLQVNTNHFEVGDIVYLLNSSTKVRQSIKLRSIYKGPYLVTKVLSPFQFKIKIRKREFVIHHDQIKPCLDRNLPLWIRQMRHNFLNLDEPCELEDLEDLGDAFNQLFGSQDDSQSPPEIGEQSQRNIGAKVLPLVGQKPTEKKLHKTAITLDSE